MLKKLTFISLILILLQSCSFLSKDKETDNDLAKKSKSKPINVKERALSDESSGIVFGGKKKDKLGSQNVMWTATLRVIDFMPISSASYDGGVIVTDWYYKDNPNESIKINISFKSNKVSPSSINVKSFKKKCENINKCKIETLGNDFNQKIKNQILVEVRNINTN